MRAFVLDRYGKQRALRLADVPVPALRDDEVLVEVHAAGVNLLDAKIRNGEFKLILPYGMPLVLGHDLAGVVIKVGARVQQFKAGDEVYARADDLRSGTFAEFIPGKESACGRPGATTSSRGQESSRPERHRSSRHAISSPSRHKTRSWSPQAKHC